MIDRVGGGDARRMNGSGNTADTKNGFAHILQITLEY